jgi:hypothetical protein
MPIQTGTRESDSQTSYYHCDEKLFTAIGDSPVTVKWVKRPDRVGEIPLLWLPSLVPQDGRSPI